MNSFHRQAIKDLAPDLEIIALSDNQQIIEAVHSAYPTKFLGVQWHPELLYGKREIEKNSSTILSINFKITHFLL